MDLADELAGIISTLERIPREKLATWHDKQMCKHYDEIYKEVKVAPERLKLEQDNRGFFATGAELLAKAKALDSFLKSVQGK